MGLTAFFSIRAMAITVALSAVLSSIGCEKGRLNQLASEELVTLSSLTITDYDALTARLNLSGVIRVEGFASLGNVYVHTTSDCSGQPVGQGLASAFVSEGVQVEVLSSQAVKLYLSTVPNIGCSQIADYDPASLKPLAPLLSKTSPASPSRVSFAPAVFGTSFPSGAIVRFYSDAACSIEVGHGSASQFAKSGIQVNLLENQTVTIRARTIDAFGLASECVTLTDYRHSSVGPQAPVFVSTTPVSPANTSVSPFVKGNVGTDASTVILFSDSACSQKLGESDRLTFTEAGLQIDVTENSTTTIYAKSLDGEGKPSACVLLTSYSHDNVAPSTPSYLTATPATPTRATVYPKLTGTGPSDAALIKFFNSDRCTTQIGSGRIQDFVSPGLFVSVSPNSITSIYGTAVDAAGNKSTCVHFLDYKHNTIPPDPPIFGGTTPISPNNLSTTPIIFGGVAVTAVSVAVYSNETCTTLVGTGSAESFMTLGFQITVSDNATTALYSTATDQEGNVSACGFLANYAHSTVPAPNPSFVATVPLSPSRSVTRPWIVGSAASTVARVRIFNDSVCSQQIGDSSRLTFVTSGVQVTVTPDTINSIYGKSLDIYGNDSACVLLTQYIHNTIPPLIPAFVSTSPVSPNKVSTVPLVKGTSASNPASVLPVTQVSLYDGPACVSRIGNGSVANFTGAGLLATVPENAVSMIYAKSFDDAGNGSACTFLTYYTHDALVPGAPVFDSSTPASPSYTRTTWLKGSFLPSDDFLALTSVDLFTDAGCTSPLVSGSPAAFVGTGLQIEMPANVTTQVYGNSTNEVGTQSTCRLLTSFLHRDIGPQNFSATTAPNGAVNLNWLPDLIAQPSPTYIIKRATSSGGPYAILSSSYFGTSYRDEVVTQGQTYFYVVAAKNLTGVSQDSLETSVTISAAVPDTATALSAEAGPSVVRLTWTGAISNMTYRVMRSQQTGGPYSLIAKDIEGSIYLDSSVVNGQSYFYVVIGVNPSGESVQSNQASAVPLALPSTPTQFKIVPTRRSSYCPGWGVQLSWVAPSYSQGYSVLRGIASGSPIELAVTPQSSFVDCLPLDTQASNLGRNYYSVSAKWGTLFSDPSQEKLFYNLYSPVLTVTPGNNEIFVSWVGNVEVNSYDVFRADAPGGPFTLVSSGSANESYYEAATNGVPRYFYVQAYKDGDFVGAPSDVAGAVPGAMPSAPSNLVLTLDPLNLPVLSWSAPAYFNRFAIYRASALMGPYSFISYSASTTFNDSSPPNGLSYYRVTALWGTGETAPTNTVSYRAGIPQNVTATSSSSNISLSWTAVSGANQYDVYRSTTTGGPYTKIGSPTGASYTDSTAAATTGYYYVVVSKFADVTVSPPSREVSGMRTGATIPSGVAVTGTTLSSITVSWVRVANASTYRLYRSLAPGGPWTQVGSSSSNMISASSLAVNTLYYFQVTATVSGNESARSVTVSGQTVSSPSAPLGNPGNSRVDLVWNSLLGVISYSIERSTDGVNFSTIASGLSSTSMSDNAVTNGQLYFYRLAAVFSSGTRWSPISSPVTPGLTPPAPTDLAVVGNANGTDVVLSWAPSSGASSYNVYVSTTPGGPWVTPSLSVSGTYFVSVSGLATDVAHYFVVSAVNGTLESSKSPEVSSRPAVTPPAPTGRAVSTTSIDVAWSAITDAVTYEIYRSTDDVTYTLLASGLATPSYSDTSVISTEAYFYRYRPVATGSVAMAMSAPSASLNTGIQPLAPMSLFASGTSVPSIVINWILVPQAVSHELYRSTTPGGPYSLIATIAAPTSTYTDTAVVAGTTYFYVMKAVNSSGVQSANSSESAVALLAAPTSLVATAVAGQNELTWTAAAGASDYTIGRSLTSGGPYGTIATGVVSTSYNDTSIENGKTYFYVVTATHGSGAVSSLSNEATAVGIQTLNLQVSIELIDLGLASSSSQAVVWERSTTQLNTTDYDGAVTYRFEVTAINDDSTARSIELIDSAANVLATLLIPPGTTQATRFTSGFVANVGPDIYKLKTDQTTTSGQLKIVTARIFIDQVGASKTKLYFPLLSSSIGPQLGDAGSPVVTTQAASYAEIDSATLFKRETASLSQIIDFNAWELDVLVSSSGGAKGAFAFTNVTRSSIVPTTETYFTSSAIVAARIPLDEGVSAFAAANEGDLFDLRVRCMESCDTGSVSLHKAGIWVKLNQLSKAQVHYRNSLGFDALTANSVLDSSRSLVDLSKFTSPSVSYQAVASGSLGSTSTIELATVGTQDTGTAGWSVVSSSQLSLTSQTKVQLRSPALTVTSTDRFVPFITPNGGSVRLNSTSVIVNTSR